MRQLSIVQPIIQLPIISSGWKNRLKGPWLRGLVWLFLKMPRTALWKIRGNIYQDTVEKYLKINNTLTLHCSTSLFFLFASYHFPFVPVVEFPLSLWMNSLCACELLQSVLDVECSWCLWTSLSSWMIALCPRVLIALFPLMTDLCYPGWLPYVPVDDGPLVPVGDGPMFQWIIALCPRGWWLPYVPIDDWSMLPWMNALCPRGWWPFVPVDYCLMCMSPDLTLSVPVDKCPLC